jgi:hypothetical protein
VPQPIATWNPARGVWEVPQTENLLCEHLAVFSETWPSSGTTRNGQAYAQPTSAPRTDDSASSYAPLTDDDLLPTPGVAGGGKQIPEDATWSGKAAYKADGTKVQVHLDRVELLLATPNHRDYKGPPSGAWSEQASLPRDVLNLLPTPNASVSQDGESFETWEVRRQAALEKGYNGNGIGMPLTIAVKLLPTPRSQHGEERNQNIWERPLDEPQNLENALARLPGVLTSQPSVDGNES